MSADESFQPNPLVAAAALRQRALNALARPQATEPALPPGTDLQETLHELRVHQVELEMQNDELRRAQRELEAASERWFELYDLAPVGYCTVSERGIITQVNLAAASLLGQQRSALVGQRLAQFIEAGDQARWRELCAEVWRASESHTCELRMAVGQGPARWVQLSVSAAPGQPGDGSLRIVMVDVTARRQAEAAEAALQLALETHRSRSEFLSRVSHEFRNPLNAILGFSYLMLHDEGSPLPPSDRQQLGHIHEAGTHLLQMVTDLLDVTSIASGKLVMHAAPVDALALLRRLIPELGVSARERGVALRLEEPLEGAVMVLADATRLRQVLQNLLSNAIKYNRPGGYVNARVQFDAAVWRLSIVDDGLGMSEAQQAGLFQPFNRLGREVAGIEGTGLGLVVTRDLVLAMGGRLTVRSEAGAGSEFSVELPACEAPAPALAARTERSLQVRPHIQGHLVCVDGDPGQRALITELLARRPGIRLELVSSGAQCLAAARRAWPDLLLINQALPDMPGLDVLQVLRQFNPHLPLRCLVMSTHATTDALQRARAAGADALVQEPLDPGLLLQQIDQILGGDPPGR